MLEAEIVQAATPNQERHIAKCSKDKSGSRGGKS